MTIPFEFVQLVGLATLAVVFFVGGAAWGRKNPNKVEQMADEIRALKAKVNK